MSHSHWQEQQSDSSSLPRVGLMDRRSHFSGASSPVDARTQQFVGGRMPSKRMSVVLASANPSVHLRRSRITMQYDERDVEALFSSFIAPEVQRSIGMIFLIGIIILTVFTIQSPEIYSPLLVLIGGTGCLQGLLLLGEKNSWFARSTIVALESLGIVVALAGMAFYVQVEFIAVSSCGAASSDIFIDKRRHYTLVQCDQSFSPFVLMAVAAIVKSQRVKFLTVVSLSALIVLVQIGLSIAFNDSTSVDRSLIRWWLFYNIAGMAFLLFIRRDHEATQREQFEHHCLLEGARERLRGGQQRLNAMAEGILPRSVLQHAENFDPNRPLDEASECTVACVGVYDFGRWATTVTPIDAATSLTSVHLRAQERLQEAGLERVAAIGDVLLMAGGLFSERVSLRTSIGRSCAALLTLTDEIQARITLPTMRSALDCGALRGGFMGGSMCRYDAVGPAINTCQAALLYTEADGLPVITETARDIVKDLASVRAVDVAVLQEGSVSSSLQTSPQNSGNRVKAKVQLPLPGMKGAKGHISPQSTSGTASLTAAGTSESSSIMSGSLLDSHDPAAASALKALDRQQIVELFILEDFQSAKLIREVGAVPPVSSGAAGADGPIDAASGSEALVRTFQALSAAARSQFGLRQAMAMGSPVGQEGRRSPQLQRADEEEQPYSLNGVDRAEVQSEHGGSGSRVGTLVRVWCWYDKFADDETERAFIESRTNEVPQTTSRVWIGYAVFQIALLALMLGDFDEHHGIYGVILLIIGCFAIMGLALLPRSLSNRQMRRWFPYWSVCCVIVPLVPLFACALTRPAAIGNDVRGVLIIGAMARAYVFPIAKLQAVAVPLMLCAALTHYLLPGGTFRFTDIGVWADVLATVAVEMERDSTQRRDFLVLRQTTRAVKQWSEINRIREGLLRSRLPGKVFDLIVGKRKSMVSRTGSIVVSPLHQDVVARTIPQTVVMLVTAGAAQLGTTSDDILASLTTQSATLEAALAETSHVLLINVFGDTALIAGPLAVSDSGQPSNVEGEAAVSESLAVGERLLDENSANQTRGGKSAAMSVLLDFDATVQVLQTQSFANFAVLGAPVFRLHAVMTSVDPAALTGVVVTGQFRHVAEQLDGDIAFRTLGSWRVRGAGVHRFSRFVSGAASRRSFSQEANSPYQRDRMGSTGSSKPSVVHGAINPSDVPEMFSSLEGIPLSDT